MKKFLSIIVFLVNWLIPGVAYWQHSRAPKFSCFSSLRRMSLESQIMPTKPNTVGNFFDSERSYSFLQCLIIGTTSIDNIQYGFGILLHAPVMLLTLNEENKLIEVSEDYPHYDHLVESISDQLESYDMLLHRTPLYLTVEGEFEEDEMILENPEINQDIDEDDDDEAEETSLDTLIAEHSPILTDSSRDDEENEDEDEDEDDGIFPDEEPPLVKNDDNIVTEASSKALYRESRFVDQIMEYAEDVKYVGSFHYRKQNYHMIRLLETQLIFGKRILSRKGYQFNLLMEKECETVRPTLERLIQRHLSSPPTLEKAPFLNEGKKQREPSSKRSWVRRND